MFLTHSRLVAVLFFVFGGDCSSLFGLLLCCCVWVGFCGITKYSAESRLNSPEFLFWAFAATDPRSDRSEAAGWAVIVMMPIAKAIETGRTRDHRRQKSIGW